MRLMYRLVGVFSLALAVLGVFLPLLPTTCFVLLSAWCFARSSPKWHARMMENQMFGGILKQWQRHRCMPAKIKWIALTSICLSGGYSLWLIEAPLLQWLLQERA